MKSTEKYDEQASGDVLSARRTFLKYSATILVANSIIGKSLAANLSAQRGQERSQDVLIEKFSAAGKSEGTVRLPRVVKSDAAWRKQLPADSYQVARLAGTEPPYSGKYWDNHADGIYRCICCDTALYDSKTKFESGTGWPSYWQPISPHNVVKSVDNTMGISRDAISCPLCDAHLGHVFNDGPKPTGLRYCMDSVSLRFVPRA
jgi:peptide-methionine (R)-S-oxide reductase